MTRRVVGWLALLGGWGLGHAGAADDLGLKVPPGFRVTVFADEALANDTYAMTLDAKGRVVVTTRGAVKTLHDADNDGRADRATVYAETETGGMGLGFDGPDLMFCGDGWLSRYRDGDGDGRADGPPERLLPLAFAEHGGHAMRKGPDGWWYVIGGNDSGIGRRHATLDGSPIVAPEAGALLRLTPDGRKSEVIAQGFRNPYDFDFNAAGDLFTYDSDVERDIFLPWYVPTRLYHVGFGGHHGWRLTGYQRSWPRPGYDPGTVEVLDPIGRGSPTGVVCYRHTRFPARYRGGLFVLDWTFGKVYFVSLKPDGAGYRAEVEVFLEPTGTSGFAPTDAVVAPDGALLISIGGRRTRGSVYRVEPVGPRVDGRAGADPSGLEAVLRAPQPLDAWSRARWEPAADRLGRAAFLRAAVDPDRPPGERLRAVEVLTERFGGLSPDAARGAAGATDAALRARVAWSVGRVQVDGSDDLLAGLAGDPEPSVRREALDAWGERLGQAEAGRVRAALVPNLGHADKRARLAAARLAAGLPGPAWSDLSRALADAPTQAGLTGSLVEILRNPDRPVHGDVAGRLCDLFAATTDPGLRLQAVRLLQRALGDYHLNSPEVEVVTGYSVQPSLAGHEAVVARVRRAVRPSFPSGDERLDDEAARLLGMLGDDDPDLPGKVAAFWTGSSSPTRDLHYLIVLARLRGPLDVGATARAVVALDRKLEGQEQRIKQSWNARLGELVGLLLAREPALGAALLREPGFVSPNHVALALALPPGERGRAARRYLDAVNADPGFAWSGPLVELIGLLPAAEARPVFREQWGNFALRDALITRLADPPEEADRGRFLDALDAPQPETVRAGLGALEALPRGPSAGGLVPLLRLLRRLTLEPKEGALRRRVLGQVERQSGERFSVAEGATDVPGLRRAYAPVFAWFERAHPALAGDLLAGGEDLAAWSRRLSRVDWSQGDAERGGVLFESRGCRTCHAGPRALGPDLAGVTGRLSRDDLFTAIVAPSLDVSPLYRTTQVETREGTVISGVVAFESADGLIVQTGATTTVRVATPDIADRHVGNRSLMPDRLLQGLTDRDLADLDRYLRSLTTQAGARGTAR